MPHNLKQTANHSSSMYRLLLYLLCYQANFGKTHYNFKNRTDQFIGRKILTTGRDASNVVFLGSNSAALILHFPSSPHTFSHFLSRGSSSLQFWLSPELTRPIKSNTITAILSTRHFIKLAQHYSLNVNSYYITFTREIHSLDSHFTSTWNKRVLN